MNELSGDWQQIGSGKPTDPFIGSPESKGRRWQIDWDGSGKSYPKINKPTHKSKILSYDKFYKEIVEPAKKSEVDIEELKMGIKVEMEHTDSKKKAAHIALQHLAEDPHYYSKLKKAGLKENIEYKDFYSDILNEEMNGEVVDIEIPEEPVCECGCKCGEKCNCGDDCKCECCIKEAPIDDDNTTVVKSDTIGGQPGIAIG